MNYTIGQIIPSHFYEREDVVQISKDLLGKKLVTQIDGIRTSGIIVETEAYRGADDKACHAYPNKLTKRTQPMFLAGGHCYVYLIYGIHHLFNIVTGPEGMANAVLIRAIAPEEGLDMMLKRRNMSKLEPRLTAGPGVAAAALGITTQYTGLRIVDSNNLIWVEASGNKVTESQMVASPRVGVGYAEECALWNWRFRIKGSKWTSKAK